MSELAYNLAGDPFDVPDGAAAWRVRRMKAQRGAPEVVYGPDGSPLTVSIDAGIDELRTAVNHAPGKYRLEPVDDTGKTLADAPVGYVYVHPTAGTATPLGPNLAALQAFATLPAAPTLPAASDSVAIEMLRMYTEGMRAAFNSNAQIATAVVAAFPAVMGATGTVLAAADGAGLPARTPRVIDVEGVEVVEADADDDEDDDEDDNTASSSPLVQFGNALAAPLLPLLPFLVPALTQKLGGMLGVPVVQAAPIQTKPTKPKTIAAPNPATVAPSAPTLAIDPAIFVKLAPLYMQLAPAEQMRATTLAAELTPTEQAAFAEQLAGMSPEAALAKVRELVGEEGD